MNNDNQCTNTEKLYSTIDEWDEKTYHRVWEKWLWGTNGNALPVEQCWDMNEMHVYGILCCIRESVVLSSNAVTYTTSEILPLEEYPELNIVHLHTNKAIQDYSLREILDQLECLQLNWGKIIGALLDNDQVELASHLLKACMSRLGSIARHAFQTEGRVLDDPQHITPLPDIQILQQAQQHHSSAPLLLTYGVVSRKCLRQSICIFFALWRVVAIVEKTHYIADEPQDQMDRVIRALKAHHIESSIDFFNVFQQMIYLAPGMRLVYRTNFAGMYNDVSQVIYFHYPKFCRQPQLSLTEIPQSNVHLLPLVMQLIPDIPVFYDDDTFIPGLSHKCLKSQIPKNNGAHAVEEPNNNYANTGTGQDDIDQIDFQWAWIVSCGEIFLIRYHKKIVDDEEAVLELGNISRQPCDIFLSENRSLVNLVAFFLRYTKRKIGDEMLDASEVIIHRNSLALTAHGHVQLLDG